MKMSMEFTLTKTELNAVKNFAKKVEDAAQLPQFLRFESHVKMNMANLKSFIGLNNTYDLKVDVEIDEAYLVQDLALAGTIYEQVLEIIPAVEGIWKLMEARIELAQNAFEVKESTWAESEVDYKGESKFTSSDNEKKFSFFDFE